MVIQNKRVSRPWHQLMAGAFKYQLNKLPTMLAIDHQAGIHAICQQCNRLYRRFNRLPSEQAVPAPRSRTNPQTYKFRDQQTNEFHMPIYPAKSYKPHFEGRDPGNLVMSPHKIHGWIKTHCANKLIALMIANDH
ncbi:MULTISPECIES: hypothetical protein [unclassified Neorhizobium]|uniref:hypothetical protein n=1 Tax=unclassified Neorhizobium TaxID=2629175 RepID=UPI001FF54010|nr:MULTISPECIES: hypothetical protein [unclassified Neorhizobium]MCJ9670384.1 hypothetical protein [Neorhizobium sp. SHOUNA12B]MCJ9746303.1 hypothetical protein [Neorhizobium sp. SHOUNA12A]